MGENVPCMILVDGGEEDQILQREHAHAPEIGGRILALEANIGPLFAHQLLQLLIGLEHGPQLFQQGSMRFNSMIEGDGTHQLELSDQLFVAVDLHQTYSVRVDEAVRRGDGERVKNQKTSKNLSYSL